MCDKLGEKTETHFEGCRVGELDGCRKMKREGRRGRKGGGVRKKERKLGNEMEKVWGRNEQNLSVKWKEVKGQILRNWGWNGRSLRVKNDGFNRTVLEVWRLYWGVTQCIPHVDEYAAVCWWTCRSGQRELEIRKAERLYLPWIHAVHEPRVRQQQRRGESISLLIREGSSARGYLMHC